MKNGEIVAAFNNLVAVIDKEEKYPVKLSYALTRNFKALEIPVKTFEEERNKLLDRYNVKNEAGKPAYKETGKFEIAKEHETDWIKDIAELLDIDVEFKPHMISVENLPENIEPDVLCKLDFMIAK